MTFNLTDRAQQIFTLLVQSYIEDGQPVASGTLAQHPRINLSSASVRNVMMQLEKQGLLASPHTSAGRIPTHQGLRLYVDRILQTPRNMSLSAESMRLESGNKSVFEKAASLLAGLSAQTSVITVPSQNYKQVERVELVRMGTQRLLVILVYDDGEVHNQLADLQQSPSDMALIEAAQILNIALCGYSLEFGMPRVNSLIRQARPEVTQLCDQICASLSRVEANGGQSMMIAGQSHLFNEAISDDVATLRQLYEAVTETKALRSMLSRCQQAQDTTLFIGQECGIGLFNSCAVIASPYQCDQRVIGSLAVIGPLRMDYRKVISVVEFTTRILSSALNQSHESP